MSAPVQLVRAQPVRGLAAQVSRKGEDWDRAQMLQDNSLWVNLQEVFDSVGWQACLGTREILAWSKTQDVPKETYCSWEQHRARFPKTAKGIGRRTETPFHHPRGKTETGWSQTCPKGHWEKVTHLSSYLRT